MDSNDHGSYAKGQNASISPCIHAFAASALSNNRTNGAQPARSIDSAELVTIRASVPIQKFLFDFIVDVEGSPAEAVDGGEDIVGRLGPAERSRLSVVGVDVLLDGGFELGR